MRTVRSSTLSAWLAKLVHCTFQPVFTPSCLCMSLIMNRTSSAVNGAPSDHLAPARRYSVRVCASSENS